jgi:hypothetical protein
MKTAQFRSGHPDIKPNSPEEIAIAERISSGYLPEDAYKAVMWDTKFGDAQGQQEQQNRQKTEAKRQANMEQRSIPAGNPLPVNQKLSLKERIKQEADKMDWS